MAYPTYVIPRSIPGAATPTYLSAALVSGYATSQTITAASTIGWYEVSSSGTLSSNPLGTSGVFTLVVDYGTVTEEKVLCSGAITIGTNVPITVWYDGTNNGRGYDGTPISAHASGTSANYNVFPVRTAVDDLQFNSATATSLQISGGTVSGNLVVASGLTVSGTSTFGGLSVSIGGTGIVGYVTISGVGGALNSYTITGTNGVFLGSLVSSGTLTVAGTTTLQGATTVNNSLNVNGYTSLSGLEVYTYNGGSSAQTLRLQDVTSSSGVYLRAYNNGGLSIVNSAFSAPLFLVDNSGNTTFYGALNAGNSIISASGVTIGGTPATGNLVITYAGGLTNTLTTQSLSTSVTNTLPNQTGTLLNTYGGQTISNGLTVLGSLGVGQNLNVNGAITSVASGITTSGLTVYGGSQLNGGVTINGGLANELTVYGGLQTTGQSTFSGVPFPLTTSTSGITATVSPASGTYTKIASLTLSSGTWLLHSQAFASNTGSTLITADFWMNTTSGVATSSLSSATTMLSAAAGGSEYSSVSMSTVSTFASATTVFFQCYCSAVGVVIQKNGASTAVPANSTSITAIRIG